MFLNINDVTTIDNPFINPYKEKNDLEKRYLAFDKVVAG